MNSDEDVSLMAARGISRRLDFEKTVNEAPVRNGNSVETPYMPASFVALCEEIRGLKLEIKLDNDKALLTGDEEE